MAPSTYSDVTPTTLRLDEAETVYFCAIEQACFVPQISKEDKIKAKAKKLRLASYHTHHQKSHNQKQIIQNCKPQHKIFKK